MKLRRGTPTNPSQDFRCSDSERCAPFLSKDSHSPRTRIRILLFLIILLSLSSTSSAYLACYEDGIRGFEDQVDRGKNYVGYSVTDDPATMNVYIHTDDRGRIYLQSN